MTEYSFVVWMRPRLRDEIHEKLSEYASFYQSGGELYEDNSEAEQSAYRKGLNRAFEILMGDSFFLLARDLDSLHV